MSDLTAVVAILATLLAAYWIAMYATDFCTRRGDQVISGVVEGVPMSKKARWMAIYCQWLPSAAFLVGFLLLVGVGLAQIAKGIDNHELTTFARVCGGFFALGGVFWALLGAFYLAHMVSAVRGVRAE
jgi:hypothetical protein